ncbi:complex I subunit 4 family protein [Anthocerotibacter panamensis]|uniref:complex I subunit 4 family protein n=1 Tax=Anthocerotibacter panamensis TaxID=2857077 RepID=UPI001C401FD3|nr:NuoM family protein [Anthocerotibacter panamensis]
MDFPWLSLIVFLPTLGALGLTLWPKEVDHAFARLWTLGVSLMTAGVSLGMALQYDFSSTHAQFIERHGWIQPLGISYTLSVDGISLPMVLLTSLLVVLSILTSWNLKERPRFYYVLLMLLTTGVQGAFLAQDLLLFFLFYELELIPLYFLIAVWGGARREYAAMKFLLYTVFSSVFLLIAFLGIYFVSGLHTFDVQALAKPAVPYSMTFQILTLVSLTVGFGIKIPIVPLHTWLPDAHVEAPTSVSVLLAGVLLKLGTYGILRFGIGLFPDAAVNLSWVLATLAAINVVYASFAALAQTDMKKMIAYSSVAHMGYVLLGIATLQETGLQGAVYQMVSHGVISALLFMLVGLVYEHAHTRDLNKLGGLFDRSRGLPLVGAFMVAAAMANAGMPGMSGFVAEFLVFKGGWAQFPLATALCIFGTVLTAIYLLLLLKKAFFGSIPTHREEISQPKPMAYFPATVLAFCMVGLGLLPNLMTQVSAASVTALVNQMNTGAAVAEVVKVPQATP